MNSKGGRTALWSTCAGYKRALLYSCTMKLFIITVTLLCLFAKRSLAASSTDPSGSTDPSTTTAIPNTNAAAVTAAPTSVPFNGTCNGVADCKPKNAVCRDSKCQCIDNSKYNSTAEDCGSTGASIMIYFISVAFAVIVATVAANI